MLKNATDGKTDVYNRLEEVEETASISKVASTQVIKVTQTENTTKIYRVVYY